MVLDPTHVKPHAQGMPAAGVAERIVDLVDVEAPFRGVGGQRTKVHWISTNNLKPWSHNSVLRQAQGASIPIGQPQLVDGPHIDRIAVADVGITKSEVDIGIESGK